MMSKKTRSRIGICIFAFTALVYSTFSLIACDNYNDENKFPYEDFVLSFILSREELSSCSKSQKNHLLNKYIESAQKKFEYERSKFKRTNKQNS